MTALLAAPADRDCDRYRTQLRDRLARDGIHPAVLDAITAEPRGPYTPYWLTARPHVMRSPDIDRGRWLAGQYSRDPILVAPPRYGSPALAMLSPHIIAAMLDLLEVHKGHSVLEVDTGSGYPTALLTRLAGAGMVRSLAPDPGWAAHTRTVLGTRADIRECHDLALTNITPDARFDRIIAWREPDHIPRGWLRHLAPGGRLVTVYGGAITVLTVNHDGLGTAAFHGPATVAALHTDPGTPGGWDTAAGPPPLDPGQPGLRLLVHSRIPGLRWSSTDDGLRTRMVLHDRDTGSRATICWHGKTPSAKQTGPEPLWDRLLHLAHEWSHLGKPTPPHWRAHLDGHHLVLNLQ
ncbi:hypothetical protein L3Q67_01475 [Saccharothrix sp. AJ9571]|nr:hypothetical protein L3Q67_01475 [Saccharothrix sp. AJ9571]